jgi:hypothetical protein
MHLKWDDEIVTFFGSFLLARKRGREKERDGSPRNACHGHGQCIVLIYIYIFPKKTGRARGALDDALWIRFPPPSSPPPRIASHENVEKKKDYHYHHSSLFLSLSSLSRSRWQEKARSGNKKGGGKGRKREGHQCLNVT